MAIRQAARADMAEWLAELMMEAETIHGLPREIAEQAARVTRARLAPLSEQSSGCEARARVTAYFWAVATRRAVRRASAREYTRALVRASLERDLREAGWEASAIAPELERCAS